MPKNRSPGPKKPSTAPQSKSLLHTKHGLMSSAKSGAFTNTKPTVLKANVVNKKVPQNSKAEPPIDQDD